MQNIAIIKQGTGRFLFSVPDNVTLREGDRVKCDTRRGITDGIAFADSAWVDENVSQLIGKLTGAKFPLKPVVGRLEYLPFEKPQDKPTEYKQGPIKLYCVKDYNPGEFLTKGKVYEIAHDGAKITYDDGWAASLIIASDNFRGEKIVPNYLVPLVKRPAKVGEWVYITHTDYAPEAGARLGVGDVCRVASVAPSGTKHLEVSPRYVLSYFDSEYLVLDGYHPEPAKVPEPEYFSGKVICVSSGDECFTVGKMYEFVNGKIKDDDGDERPVCYDKQFKSVEDWNSECGMPIARFVEFKGEAHD